jgi:NAD(P)-dependent dehydrogenase (short-subunit alcohol dehydrogenase family)
VGVRVVLVEPAQTDTDMWRSAVDDFDAALAAMSPAHRELYDRHLAGFRRRIPLSQRMAAPAEGVAKTIERALTARRPRARYVVGAPVRIQAALLRFTPTAVLDPLLRVATGVPRRR